MTIEMLRDKIDDVKEKEFKLKTAEYTIFQGRELDSRQRGYRYNDVGTIDEWNSKFYIIGKENMSGDLLLIDHTDINMPVYSMASDYWSLVYQVSTSLDEFIEIVKKLEKFEFKDRVDTLDLLKETLSKLPEECSDYWNIIFSSEFEFTTQEDLFDIDE